MMLVTLNMTGPYCPRCDLIILHRDKVENLLVHALSPQHSSLIGNDYLIIGTIERSFWRKAAKGQATNSEIFDHLHDFKNVLVFEPMRPRWSFDETPKKN